MSKKTFECATLAQAIFITQVKNNQEDLLKQIEHGCKIQSPLEKQEDRYEKSHGRLERRTYEMFDSLPMLKKWRKDWPYIRYIIRVTRYRERLYSSKEPTIETHYYVSNRLMTALQYGQHIRQHWYIENKCNHVKDVAFQEDATTKRVNPLIFSACIDFAMNILRSSGVDNMRKSIYEASLDIFVFLEKYNILYKTSRP